MKLTQLIALCVVAAVGGVCCLVLPPYLTKDGIPDPAYGWPLIPWFAVAWANTRLISMFFYFLLGFVLGLLQPRWWWLLGILSMLFSPILMGINILHDWKHDPTSHNLWPFEFLIYGFMSSPALVGTLLGFLVRRRSNQSKP